MSSTSKNYSKQRQSGVSVADLLQPSEPESSSSPSPAAVANSNSAGGSTNTGGGCPAQNQNQNQGNESIPSSPSVGASADSEQPSNNTTSTSSANTTTGRPQNTDQKDQSYDDDQRQAQKRALQSMPVFRAYEVDNNNTNCTNSPKPKKKRRRVPVSCSVCRTRKLKCDREHPCGSCKQLRLTQHCHFETPETYLENFDRPLDNNIIPVEDLSVQQHGDGSSSGDGVNQYPAAALHTNSNDISNISRNNSISGVLNTTSAAAGVTTDNNNNNNTVFRQLFQLFKGKLIHANGINRFIPPTDDCCLPDIRAFHDFEQKVELTNMDTISKLKLPESTPSPDPQRYPYCFLPKILDRDMGLSKWNDILMRFPPVEVCEYMGKRFLQVYSKLFCEDSQEILKYDVNEARQIHLRYMLNVRQGGQNVNGPPFKLSMHDIHKVCLILLVVHMGWLTMPSGWSTTQIPGIDEDIYLGDGLRQLAWAAVEATDLETENSLKFVKLLYFLAVYQNVMVFESDRFGNYTDSKLVSLIIQSSQINGLHEDPTKFKSLSECEQILRKKFWRQVIFIDAMHSLTLTRYPTVRLEFNYAHHQHSADASEYHQVVDNLCSLIHEVLNRVLLTSSGIATENVLFYIQSKISALKNTITAPNTQLTSVQSLFCQMLIIQLQAKLDRACAIDNHQSLTKTSMSCLVVERELEESGFLSPLSPILAMRYARASWYHLVYSLLDLSEFEKCLPVLERVVTKESKHPGSTVKLQSIPDVIDLILGSYKFVLRHTSESFFCWFHHVNMHSMLVCLKNALPEGLSSKLDIGKVESPRDPRWVDWLVRQLEREWAEM